MANPKQPATRGAPERGHPSLRIKAELRVDLTKPTDRCPACGALFSDTTQHP